MKKLIAAACIAIFGVSAVVAMSGCDSDVTTYKIATDENFAPFEYQIADGDYDGIDVELMDAIAEDQGFEVEWDRMGFDEALSAVQDGQDDAVIAGMSITEERQKIFDFSDTYYDSTVCCAVASSSTATSLDDLKGAKIATKLGTISNDWAQSLKDTYGWTITTFDDSTVMYQDVVSGNSAACFEDTFVMTYATSTGSVDLKIIANTAENSKYAAPYGLAVKKGENSELLEKFNAGLANIKESGKYDEIINTYAQ